MPIAKNFGFSPTILGFNPIDRVNVTQVWFFIPIIILELLGVFTGFREELTFPLGIACLFLTLAVAFTEETYFMEMIPQVLSSHSLKSSLIFSSFLFSVGHFANLLAGTTMLDTLLQVVFAFFFGLVALMLALITKSIWIPILWHFVHNSISMMTIDNDGQISLIIGSLQTILLIIYAIKLWPVALNSQK